MHAALVSSTQVLPRRILLRNHTEAPWLALELFLFRGALLVIRRTSTDLDYARVEGVVAHEYFHNWTGNRVTCRDWFQLTLKEGLTVFRDQVRGVPWRWAAQSSRVERVHCNLCCAGPAAPCPREQAAGVRVTPTSLYLKANVISNIITTLLWPAGIQRGHELAAGEAY